LVCAIPNEIDHFQGRNECERKEEKKPGPQVPWFFDRIRKLKKLQSLPALGPAPVPA
jgi:hypothetical protein